MDRNPRERHGATRERRSNKPHRLLKTKLFFGSLAATATLASMAIERDPNPVSALNDMSLAVLDIIGSNTCPEGPDEIQRSGLINRLMAVDYNIGEAYTEALNAGLTFADPTLVNEELATFPDAQAATQLVSAYTEENFGFAMQLEAPSELFASDEARTRYSQNLRNFTRYTSMLPRELLHNLDIDSVNVVDNSNYHQIKPGDIEPGSADNVRTPFTRRYINLHYELVGLPGTFIHEGMGHILQFKLCGVIPEKDDAFTEFNPVNFSYGQSGESHSPEFVSNYATTDLNEDFADTAESLASNAGTGVTNLRPWPEMPQAILNKTAVVMYRLDSLAPGSAAYLAEARLYFADMDCTVLENFLEAELSNC